MSYSDSEVDNSQASELEESLSSKIMSYLDRIVAKYEDSKIID